jgi:hypothetical protein
MELSGTYQQLVYADDFNILGKNVYIIKKNKEDMLEASMEVGLEGNTEKTMYMIMF